MSPAMVGAVVILELVIGAVALMALAALTASALGAHGRRRELAHHRAQVELARRAHARVQADYARRTAYARRRAS